MQLALQCRGRGNLLFGPNIGAIPMKDCNLSKRIYARREFTFGEAEITIDGTWKCARGCLASRACLWRWRITAPALLPRAAAAGAIVFVLALGEIGPVVLLSPPGKVTASQHLFNLMHYGYDEVVASIALLLFGATALVTWSGMHVGRLRTNRLAA